MDESLAKAAYWDCISSVELRALYAGMRLVRRDRCRKTSFGTYILPSRYATDILMEAFNSSVNHSVALSIKTQRFEASITLHAKVVSLIELRARYDVFYQLNCSRVHEILAVLV